MPLLVLVSMMFCHIIDDYKLQGWLATGKQRSWWKSNAPEKLYKYDYIMALVEHAFSWTFMIHVPIFIYSYMTSSWSSFVVYIVLFIFNWAVHAITDHAKANLLLINLVIDQTIHIIQILLTWAVYMYGGELV